MTTPRQEQPPQAALRPSDVAGIILVILGSALVVGACWLVDYRLGMGVLGALWFAVGTVLGYERSR